MPKRILLLALLTWASITAGFAKPSHGSVLPVPSPTAVTPALSPAPTASPAAITPNGSPSLQAPAPTLNAQPAPDQDTVTLLQIFLDEHSFGPGKIDGHWGEFVGKALQRYQTSVAREPTGQLDPDLRQEIQKISPIYVPYTLTKADLQWVGTVPTQPSGMVT